MLAITLDREYFVSNFILYLTKEYAQNKYGHTINIQKYDHTNKNLAQQNWPEEYVQRQECMYICVCPQRAHLCV